MNYLTYKINVDGESIGTTTLKYPSTQDERDICRKQLAKEYQIPTHYIRLKQWKFKD